MQGISSAGGEGVNIYAVGRQPKKAHIALLQVLLVAGWYPMKAHILLEEELGNSIHPIFD